MRGRQQPIIIMAKQGGMQADIDTMSVTIVLRNGTLHNTDGRDSQIVRFRRYQLHIPLKPPTRIDGDDVTKLSRGSMSQEQLLTAAYERGGENTQAGVVYLTEYHHRLALPVGCLILSLLGLPLGLQAGPGRRAVGIPLGLAFFVLYYIVFTLFRVMAEDMVLPVFWGMWLPNILFAGMTGLIFRRVDQEQPILPERVSLLLEAVLNILFFIPLQRFFRLFTLLLNRRKTRTTDRLPEEPVQEGMLVHADAGRRVFHLPGCRDYHGEHSSLQFRSISVAREAGFEACPYCEKQMKKYTAE
jgi:lipopolysaccharide export system permease protein